jgi:PleD family two-component response regulator
MSDHDILSDAEREALSAVMLEPDLPPQRVLIVDDDKDARELLSEILALDGIRCMTAASGETAEDARGKTFDWAGDHRSAHGPSMAWT